jgi:hypothetical protein
MLRSKLPVGAALSSILLSSVDTIRAARRRGCCIIGFVTSGSNGSGLLAPPPGWGRTQVGVNMTNGHQRPPTLALPRNVGRVPENCATASGAPYRPHVT